MKHPAGELPSVAERLFPTDRLDLVQRYADLLATDGVERGLIGPRETPRLWQRHVLNCALLADRLPRDATVADIGSGAGLPGIVLALARPDLRVSLVESLLRRTTFLDEAVTTLGLDRVEVLRSRAEELAGKRAFDIVTARAVAPLERLTGWCLPLVAPGGALWAMKGSSAAEEVATASADLRRRGCAPPVIETLGEELPGVEPTTLVRVSAPAPGRVSLRTSAGSAGRSTRRRRR